MLFKSIIATELKDEHLGWNVACHTLTTGQLQEVANFVTELTSFRMNYEKHLISTKFEQDHDHLLLKNS